MTQASGALKSSNNDNAYVSMNIGSAGADLGYGFSWYASAFPMIDAPIDQFQVGLPGTWVTPNNRGRTQSLCPPASTSATDYANRAPYLDMFQTIEGSMGRWRGIQFGPAPPSGSLAELDGAIVLTPPRGLEAGYVPVAVRQWHP